MLSVWDRKTELNGVSAKDILDANKHLQDEEAIFIEAKDGVVTYMEGKSILARAFNIDHNLPNDEFIAEYERIMAKIMG